MGGSSCIHSVNRWSAGQLKQCALKLYVLSFFQLFLKARWAFTCNLHPKMLLESLSVTTQNMSLLISRNTYQAAPKQFLTFWVALCFPDIAQPTGYRRERLGTRLLMSVNLQRRCYSVMGIPIPKPLVKWTFPSLITLAIWVRVRVKVTVDAHITVTPPLQKWQREWSRKAVRNCFWDSSWRRAGQLFCPDLIFNPRTPVSSSFLEKWRIQGPFLI